MPIYIKEGSGRATCKVCGNKIKREEISAEIYGRHFSEQYHPRCLSNYVLNSKP